MSIYLDSQSSAYLDARGIGASNAQAMESDLQNAMQTLSLSLQTGEPVDPDMVHFIMDYHNDSNDSTTGFPALTSFLYAPQPTLGNKSRVDYYLTTLNRPLTDALAPLLSSALFAPTPAARYANLYIGLNNAKTLNLPPPAEALTVLAQAGPFDPDNNSSTTNNTTGTAAVKLFAEYHIDLSISKKQPIDAAVLDAYIASDPATARTFIGTKLKAGNLDQKQLMDAYLALNPNNATPAYTVNELGLDTNFLTLVNATQQPLTGWASMAVKQLLSRPDKPVDAALLAQLKEVAPQAAAWVSYQLLKAQIAVPSPTLSSAALSTLGAYHQALMITVAKEQLNGQLTRGNYLDDNAYQALAAVDRASSQEIYGRYSDAGLVPPPPKPGELSAEDFAAMSVGKLMQTVQFARADLMESEIKSYVAKIHAQNVALANFQKLQVEVQDLEKLIPVGALPSATMASLSVSDTAIGLRMNTLLNDMTGFKLFPSTSNGQYNPGSVTVEQVRNALKTIEDQKTSLSTTLQQDVTSMNLANNNRNEAMEWLSNMLKKLQDTRAAILRNM